MKRYLKKVFKSTDKEKIMDVKIENDIAKVFVCIDSDFKVNGMVNELLDIIDDYHKNGYYDLFIDKTEQTDYHKNGYYDLFIDKAEQTDYYDYDYHYTTFLLYGYRNETIEEREQRKEIENG